MLAHFFCATLEPVINKVISLDPKLAQRLALLVNQPLVIDVRDWQQHICVLYTQSGLMLMTHREKPEHCACFISADSSTLMHLKDPSLLTQLIRQDKLELAGDIHLAQAYSQAFSELDIDWAEQLSRYVGDAPAQAVYQGVQHANTQVKSNASKVAEQFTSLMQDELKVTIHPLELTVFTQQNRQLKTAVDALSTRIDTLSHQLLGEGN